MTAIGLSSLAESQRRGFGIDSTWIKPDDNAMDRLEAQDVDLALLRLDEIGSGALEGRLELRAVMRYWTTEGDTANDGEKMRVGHLLVTHAAVPSDRVEALLEMALQDHILLEAARIDVTSLTPEEALIDLPITAHAGVENYLRGRGIALQAEPAPSRDHAAAGAEERPARVASEADAIGTNVVETAVASVQLAAQRMSRPLRSFTLYFDTAEASVDQPGVQTVADACRFAASLPGARFVISGHTDTVGPDTYNRDLSNRRALAVADAIRNDPRFREALNVVEFGEQRLAVATADGVDEPMNRRVEITIYEE
ncbi:MAG: OmpA family protein [Geminicoccaceae bacterium]